MNKDRSFQPGALGCLTEVRTAVLAIGVILAISAYSRDFDAQFACGGGLGAGFPVAYLCDYGAGGSPIDNWGRIDLSDFPYFSFQGLLVDILFYAAILWIGWLFRRLFRQHDSYPLGTTLWVTVVGVAFLIGFLAAATLYKADRVNFHNYILGIPSPLPATPTPFGPPPAESPVPTSGP